MIHRLIGHFPHFSRQDFALASTQVPHTRNATGIKPKKLDFWAARRNNHLENKAADGWNHRLPCGLPLVNMDFNPDHNAEDPIQWYQHCMFSIIKARGKTIFPLRATDRCNGHFPLRNRFLHSAKTPFPDALPGAGSSSARFTPAKRVHHSMTLPPCVPLRFPPCKPL
jgi:hypothetical protein